MTPQPDRVAQVVAWLRGTYAIRCAQVCHGSVAEMIANAIEAGEPFKETPDE